jgi:hypothetical protein
MFAQMKRELATQRESAGQGKSARQDKSARGGAPTPSTSKRTTPAKNRPTPSGGRPASSGRATRPGSSRGSGGQRPPKKK